MDTEQELQVAVLEWWFADSRESLAKAKARAKVWYSDDPDVDAEIRKRFSDVIGRACAGKLTHWQESPQGCLALVILADQFTRNVYRRQAEAFSGDDIALFAASHAVDNRFESRLAPLESSFLFHPFMHSEDPEHQARCVNLFTRLIFACPSAWTPWINDNLDYAKEHRDVIERFGRFPHRNEVLGRESTAEELEYLKKATRYGQ